MTDKWPSYKVADDDSVCALGVMNINYVRFEATLVYMLAAVANMKPNQAAVFISRTGAAERANLIKVFASKRKLPAKASTGIDHYLKALRTLTRIAILSFMGTLSISGVIKIPASSPWTAKA